MKVNEKELIVSILKDTLKEIWNRTGDELPEALEKLLITQKEDDEWAILTEKLVVFLEEHSENKEKNDCLSSIFNELNGNSENYSWDAIGKTLFETVSYPTKERKKWERDDYIKLQNKIIEDFLCFKREESNFDAFMDALEDDIFYIPTKQGNDEISLFEHMKMRMAIGSCLNRFFETNIDVKTALSTEMLLLVSMDVSGIQDFIYTISSKGALKALRARSFFLEIMMEHMVDEILEMFRLGRTNLIYSGGGHSYLLLPNVKNVLELLQEKMNQFNEWLLQKFQTDLYIGYGAVSCSIKQLKDQPSGSYSQIFQSVSRQISAKKMRRYSAKQIMCLNYQEYKADMRECSICKRLGNLDEDNHCEICGNLLRFSKNILKQEYFAITEHSTQNGLPLPGDKCLIPIDVENVSDMNMVRIYKKNGPDRKWYRAKQILVGDYTAKETLEELAQESEGVKRLAIYRADVDNLGNAFVAGFVNKVTGKNMASLSRTAVLSRQLSLFFKYHINHFLKGMEIAIVYAGGDDLFILGAWDDVLKAAMKIEKELCKYTQGTLTLSGGIGVYSSGSPVHVMAEESSELEEQSKRQPGKNAVTVFTEEHSYPWYIFKEKVMGEKYKELDAYFSITNEHGNSFLYHLLELIRECDEKINFVRYVYLLSRMEPENSKDNKEEWDAYHNFSSKMYQWIQKPEDREQLITAIYIYVYKNRKKV